MILTEDCFAFIPTLLFYLQMTASFLFHFSDVVELVPVLIVARCACSYYSLISTIPTSTSITQPPPSPAQPTSIAVYHLCYHDKAKPLASDESNPLTALTSPTNHHHHRYESNHPVLPPISLFAAYTLLCWPAMRVLRA